MMIAAAVGLRLESRLVQYEPDEGSTWTRVLQVLIGISGIALFLLWDRSQSEQVLLLGAWTAGLATLWTVLGAPALFCVLGVAGHSRASRGNAVFARGNGR